MGRECRELPSLPATSSGQHWSTIGARRIPAIVGGGEAAPIYPAVVCAMILITTGFCTYLLIKFRPYNSVPAPLRAEPKSHARDDGGR